MKSTVFRRKNENLCHSTVIEYFESPAEKSFVYAQNMQVYVAHQYCAVACFWAHFSQVWPPCIKGGYCHMAEIGGCMYLLSPIFCLSSKKAQLRYAKCVRQVARCKQQQVLFSWDGLDLLDRASFAIKFLILDHF